MKNYLAIFGICLSTYAAAPLGPAYNSTGRMLVDVGTNITVTGTVTTETNVSLSNITSANPLPVYMPTNTFNVGITNDAVENVGGFTYIGTAAVDVDTTATGIAANKVLAPVVSIPNAVRTANGTGMLTELVWMHGGTITDPNVKPEITILVCTDTITWPKTNETANLTQTDLPKILRRVTITSGDFDSPVGTNHIATKEIIGCGIRPTNTTLYLYCVNKTATTNSNPSRVKWTILQD